MVKLNDEMLLNATAIGAGAFTVGLVAAPSTFNKQMFSATHQISNDHPFFVHAGTLAATVGAMSAVAAKADRDTRKKFLKISGACWLATAAADAYGVRRGTQPRDSSTASILGGVALGTLSLVAGFQKDII